MPCHHACLIDYLIRLRIEKIRHLIFHLAVLVIFEHIIVLIFHRIFSFLREWLWMRCLVIVLLLYSLHVKIWFWYALIHDWSFGSSMEVWGTLITSYWLGKSCVLLIFAWHHSTLKLSPRVFTSFSRNSLWSTSQTWRHIENIMSVRFTTFVNFTRYPLI